MVTDSCGHPSDVLQNLKNAVHRTNGSSSKQSRSLLISFKDTSSPTQNVSESDCVLLLICQGPFVQSLNYRCSLKLCSLKIELPVEQFFWLLRFIHHSPLSDGHGLTFPIFYKPIVIYQVENKEVEVLLNLSTYHHGRAVA